MRSSSHSLGVGAMSRSTSTSHFRTLCLSCVTLCLHTVRMYVCSKVKNSQARTGHQRGMGGRKTDDDDTHERHTDTNKLTRHTASGLPHILSGRTHHSGHVPPVAPPSTPRCQETNNSTTTQTGDRGERVRLEQACSASSNLVAGRKARTRPCVGSCEVSMDALLTG